MHKFPTAEQLERHFDITTKQTITHNTYYILHIPTTHLSTRQRKNWC